MSMLISKSDVPVLRRKAEFDATKGANLNWTSELLREPETGEASTLVIERFSLNGRHVYDVEFTADGVSYRSYLASQIPFCRTTGGPFDVATFSSESGSGPFRVVMAGRGTPYGQPPSEIAKLTPDVEFPGNAQAFNAELLARAADLRDALWPFLRVKWLQVGDEMTTKDPRGPLTIEHVETARRVIAPLLAQPLSHDTHA